MQAPAVTRIKSNSSKSVVSSPVTKSAKKTLVLPEGVVKVGVNKSTFVKKLPEDEYCGAEVCIDEEEQEECSKPKIYTFLVKEESDDAADDLDGFLVPDDEEEEEDNDESEDEEDDAYRGQKAVEVSWCEIRACEQHVRSSYQEILKTDGVTEVAVFYGETQVDARFLPAIKDLALKTDVPHTAQLAARGASRSKVANKEAKPTKEKTAKESKPVKEPKTVKESKTKTVKSVKEDRSNRDETPSPVQRKLTKKPSSSTDAKKGLSFGKIDDSVPVKEKVSRSRSKSSASNEDEPPKKKAKSSTAQKSLVAKTKKEKE